MCKDEPLHMNFKSHELTLCAVDRDATHVPKYDLL